MTQTMIISRNNVKLKEKKNETHNVMLDKGLLLNASHNILFTESLRGKNGNVFAEMLLHSLAIHNGFTDITFFYDIYLTCNTFSPFHCNTNSVFQTIVMDVTLTSFS